MGSFRSTFTFEAKTNCWALIKGRVSNTLSWALWSLAGHASMAMPVQEWFDNIFRAREIF